MKSIVVAVDENGAIGAKGDLPWGRDLPADLQNFKRITLGGSVIMGRKTFESLKKPLIDRENIVISRTYSASSKKDIRVAHSVKEAYSLASKNIFVIGGSEIFEQTMNDVDRVYLTVVREVFSEADTFFPQLDLSSWREASKISHPADDYNKYPFDFIIYDRT